MNTHHPDHRSPHPEEPIANLFKLIDVCNACGRTFDAAGKFAANSGLRQLASRICQSLTRFRFELHEESRRVDTDGSGPRDHHSPSLKAAAALDRNCRESLDRTVEEYRAALETHMPAHTRAMIRRQNTELKAFREELDRLTLAA